MRNSTTVLSILLVTAPVFLVAQESVRPDILFISIDDLNDWVGPLGGHPQAHTPNMDRLAEQGMVFTNAQAPALLCNPSRTALFTGLRPSTTGVYLNQPDWRTVDRLEGIRTIPRYFREEGYSTSGAGKLFHSSTYNTRAYFGFNDTTAWDAYYPSLDRQLPDEIRPHDRPANNNPYSPNFDWSAVTADDRAMGDGQVIAWSEQQIAKPDGPPRFTGVGIYRPHLPWYLPQEYFDLFPLDTIQLPPVIDNDLEDIPDIAIQSATTGINMPAMGLHKWVLEAGVWKEGVRAYLASIAFADAMLGRLLDALEQSGRSEHTMIVLWSDHGWHLGEKERWRKQTLWRESTRVPLIIVAPGVSQARTSTNAAVSLMDLYPTLIELAGLEKPHDLEGVSLVPLLENPDAPWDRAVVTTNGFRSHAVANERYRYIRYSDGAEELYDLLSDPNEWKNLAGMPALSAVQRELATWLPEHDEPNAARQNQ